MQRRSRYSDTMTSLRPRPVTATVTKPSWMRPEAIVGPRSRSVESRGSTASLTSVLEHESCESLSEDEFGDDHFQSPTPARVYSEQKENMENIRNSQKQREIQYNTYSRKEKKVVKKKMIRKVADSSQTDENETENEPGMSPWEQWLIEKVKEDREKRREDRQKKKEEKLKKDQEQVVKEKKLQKADENRKDWVERKNFEEKLKKKLDKQREKTENMIKEEQKKMTEVKAERKFQEWIDQKKQEQRQKKREEKLKEEEEQRLQKDQKVKAQKRFEEWCRRADQKPKPLPNSFGYTSGKLTGYHDTSAYPVPTFYNPMPWQPIHIPRPASEKKSKRKQKPKPNDKSISSISADITDGQVNVGYNKTDESSLPSTSFVDEPPSYEEAAKKEVVKTEVDIEKIKEDERILAVLRDVARKCTNANPAKRPTAKEVLKMLEEVAPKDLIDDRLEISSDDDGDEEDVAVKKSK